MRLVGHLAIRHLGLVFFGLVTASCSPALPPEQQALVDSLDQAVASMPGWSVVSGTTDSFASLARATEQAVQVTLEAGRTYRFVGRCDANCAHLSLSLYDPEGLPVSSDGGAGNTPSYDHVTRVAGVYSLRIQMGISCDTVPTCNAAARVLSQ